MSAESDIPEQIFIAVLPYMLAFAFAVPFVLGVVSGGSA